MTDRYAVIGNPIAQSRSPRIHGLFAQATGQRLEYTKIECAPGAFVATVREFAANGGRGLSVTAPFKIEAFELADERSERAANAGAANSLRFDGGRVLAENFDGIGLVNDIERNLGVALAGKSVLLLGAGGATRGVLLPLLERKPGEIVIANRTADKARELERAFASQGPVRGCGLGELGTSTFDIVVNATSASLQGEPPAVPRDVFAGAALAYEMVYGKGLTPFLRQARDGGARRVADGVGMVVEQAAEQFLWWRGVRPETRAVLEDVRMPLE